MSSPHVNMDYKQWHATSYEELTQKKYNYVVVAMFGLHFWLVADIIMALEEEGAKVCIEVR